jgi:oligoendopeptidase F
MNASTVIAIARNKLRDASGPDYTWNTPTLLRYLNDAQRDVLAKRPDLRLASDYSMTAITTPSAVGTALLLDEDWAQALADFVAYCALIEENSDPANAQRANVHYSMYLNKLGVRNG